MSNERRRLDRDRIDNAIKRLQKFVSHRLPDKYKWYLKRETYCIDIGKLNIDEAIVASNQFNALYDECHVNLKPQTEVSCPLQDPETYMCLITIYQ